MVILCTEKWKCVHHTHACKAAYAKEFKWNWREHTKQRFLTKIVLIVLACTHARTQTYYCRQADLHNEEKGRFFHLTNGSTD